MSTIYFAIPPPKYEPNADFLSFFHRFDTYCTTIEANPALKKHLLINSLDEDLSWDVRGRDLSLFDLEYDELVKRGTEARPPVCSTESNKCRVLNGTQFDADRAIPSLAFAVRKRICAVETTETPAPEEQAAESTPAEEAAETPAHEEQAAVSAPAEEAAKIPAPEEQAAESTPAEEAAETPAPEEQAAESTPAEEAAETPAPEEQAAESTPAEQATETPAPEEQAAESAPTEQAAETPVPEEQAAGSAPAEEAAETSPEEQATESAPAEQAAETPAPEEQAAESAPASKQRIWDVGLFRCNHEVSQSSDFCAVESSATPGDGCSTSWTVGLGCVVLINNGAPDD
ncbi:uncharacterized protein LOC143461028 [Clavelina lepadiformis]|uniref:uncharacterized protein LOC143461028 n=1 Tax=Clavelina lepadiformis TaxID=159417 RepID=UPI004041E123